LVEPSSRLGSHLAYRYFGGDFRFWDRR
jgi:hypothetical protein